jgi:hypothetical protein
LARRGSGVTSFFQRVREETGLAALGSFAGFDIAAEAGGTVFSVGWGGGMGSMLGSLAAGCGPARYFSKTSAIERSKPKIQPFALHG